MRTQEHPHSGLIDSLGGNKTAAALLAQQTGEPVRPETVKMWRYRGVPWRVRSALAKVAAMVGAQLPEGFTT
jgi:hypothetical protein